MLNTATIMGRLTADPELKATGSGINVCSFRVAVERDTKPENGKRPCDFISVVAWREKAEFVSRYFRKGNMIVVQGSIQVRSYEDKNGVKREAVEIVADKVHFGGSKNDGQRDEPPPPPPPAAPKGQSYSPSKPGYDGSPDSDFDEIPCDDDLPF